MAAIDLLVLQGFIAATRDAIETMAGLDVEVIGIQPISAAPASFGVLASMTLSGASPGRVAIGLGEETAMTIIASMLDEDPKEVSREEMLDGASELANLVAGGARTHLKDNETDFELSLPQVQGDVSNSFSLDDPDSAFVELRVSGGPLSLLLRMS